VRFSCQGCQNTPFYLQIFTHLPTHPHAHTHTRSLFLLRAHTHTHKHMHSLSPLPPISLSFSRVHALQHTATHTATHCNTPQHTATHCSTLKFTATQCNNFHICNVSAFHPHSTLARTCIASHTYSSIYSHTYTLLCWQPPRVDWCMGAARS